MKEHKTEIDSLLTRAEFALSRLKKVINDFDGSIAVPDCFHDIIRIYRSCHELDKILKTSFFSEPELQQLIAQAKGELKKDKNNKISRHLTQLFETWSRSVPNAASSGRTFGLVGADGKTRTYGNVSKEVDNFESKVDSFESKDEILAKDTEKDKKENDITTNVSEAVECSIENEPSQITEVEESTSINPGAESRVLKKEFSAPAISSLNFGDGATERRPSDPIIEGSNSFPQETKSREASLVGENCVAKASKRTKSEGFEDCEREAKKSREDNKNPNQNAQELCFKICKCLQKQILLIHEDMNKRSNRLFSAMDKESVAEGAKESSDEENVKKPSDSLKEASDESSPVNCDIKTSSSVIDDNAQELAVCTNTSLQNPKDNKLGDSDTSLDISQQKTLEIDDSNNIDEQEKDSANYLEDDFSHPLSELLSDDVPCKG